MSSATFPAHRGAPPQAGLCPCTDDQLIHRQFALVTLGVSAGGQHGRDMLEGVGDVTTAAFVVDVVDDGAGKAPDQVFPGAVLRGEVGIEATEDTGGREAVAHESNRPRGAPSRDEGDNVRRFVPADPLPHLWGVVGAVR